MMDKQEIRAKSMELALKFMGLTCKLPLTNELANEEGFSEQEFDRAFKTAVECSKRFEAFILKAST